MKDNRYEMLLERIKNKRKYADGFQREIMDLIIAWARAIDRKTFNYRLANFILNIDQNKVVEDWEKDGVKMGGKTTYLFSEIYRAITSRNLDKLESWQREPLMENIRQAIDKETKEYIENLRKGND